MAGKLNGRDARHHAERLADLVDVDTGARLLGEPALEQVRDAARELEVLEATRDLTERVRRHLAVLRGEVGRQLVTALVDQVADLEQDVGALAQRRGTPAGEGSAGGGDGGRDLVGRRKVDVLRDDARRGIVDIALAARRAGRGAPADPMADAPRRGGAGDLGFGDLGHRRVLVARVVIRATIPGPLRVAIPASRRQVLAHGATAGRRDARQNGGRVSGSGQFGRAAAARACSRRGHHTDSATAPAAAVIPTTIAIRPPAGRLPMTAGSRHVTETTARTAHQPDERDQQPPSVSRPEEPERARHEDQERDEDRADRLVDLGRMRRHRRGRGHPGPGTEIGRRPVPVERTPLPAAAQGHGQLPARDRRQQWDRRDVRPLPNGSPEQRRDDGRVPSPPTTARLSSSPPIEGSNRVNGPAANASGTVSA